MLKFTPGPHPYNPFEPEIEDRFRGHVVERPECDLNQLAPGDRKYFEGYKPGTQTMHTAGQSRAYESQFGDAKITAAVNDWLDEDETDLFI